MFPATEGGALGGRRGGAEGHGRAMARGETKVPATGDARQRTNGMNNVQLLIEDKGRKDNSHILS